MGSGGRRRGTQNAYCRAYNRWIADFCRDSGGRLIPIAHISMGDVPAPYAELERAVKDGCKGAFVAPFNHQRKAHGHPDFDPLFAKFQELDIPYGIHPTFEPTSLASRRFSGLGSSIWYHQVTACYGAQVAFTTLFSFGVFDKFPKLKTVVLESGGGMDRLLGGQDGRAVRGPDKSRAAEKPPSHYIRTQCWISADPDERALAGLIKFVGEDRFFWASDFPHQDHGREYMNELKGLLAEMPAARGRNSRVRQSLVCIKFDSSATKDASRVLIGDAEAGIAGATSVRAIVVSTRRPCSPATRRSPR